jgi:endonuclease YncB( thermonuclease family)
LPWHAICFCAALLALWNASATAQTSVTDGDTIRLNGIAWRLYGIDAPESAQWCGDYPAGARAARTLEQLVAGAAVACELRDRDRYGRSVGICRAGNRDLGANMVRLGMAWAFVRYSSDYVSQEEKAKGERLGVHRHGCQPAWEWRALNRSAR